MSILLKLVVTIIATTTLSTALFTNPFERSVRLASTVPSTDYDAYYDFSYENQTHEFEGVSVVHPLTYTGCSTRGVLKISIDPDDVNKRRVKIDLIFTYPSGWAFNLGDSTTNKGSGGDQGSFSNDAEIVYNHGFVTGYLNQKTGNRRAFRVVDVFSTKLSLIVGDEHVVWLPDNASKANYYYNPDFFALNSQSDTQGPVNNDLYLGVNRVIRSDSNRFGAGLCAVGIKYLPLY